MKRNLIFLTCLIVLGLLAASCGSKKPTESTVNLPVVGGDAQATTVAPQQPEASAPANTYPVGDSAAQGAHDPALAYPIDKASPTYEAEMRAFVEKILNGAYKIEDLVKKDEAQLREILTTAAQGKFILTEGQLKAAIDWLLKK